MKKAGEKSRYVIIRSTNAGCFAGDLVSSNGNGSVTLENARRLWYWAGAASLSQLAMEGSSQPKACKFPQAVTRIEVLGVIEIIDVSKKAEASIKATPIWRA